MPTINKRYKLVYEDLRESVSNKEAIKTQLPTHNHVSCYFLVCVVVLIGYTTLVLLWIGNVKHSYVMLPHTHSERKHQEQSNGPSYSIRPEDKKTCFNTDDDDWNFQVATWNVWFGPNGDGQPHPVSRMEAIVNLLLQQSIDGNPLLFIGFQEVINELAVILIPALEKAGYHVYRQPGDAMYGCAIAVHKCLQINQYSWNPYRSEITVMNRGFHSVRATLLSHRNDHHYYPQNEILFTTTHLESWIGSHYTGANQRILQLQDLERYCNVELLSSMSNGSASAMAIITGDLNWDDMSGYESLDPDLFTVLTDSSDWHDVWLSTLTSNNNTNGYTYDKILNPMLSGTLQRRFDRCLVRSQPKSGKRSGKVVDAKLLGLRPISNVTWDKWDPSIDVSIVTKTLPSDHFGLIAHVKIA